MALRAKVGEWTIETDTVAEMVELMRASRVISSAVPIAPATAIASAETKASAVGNQEVALEEDDGLPRGQLKAIVHEIMTRSKFPLRIVEVKDMVHKDYPSVPYYSIRTILQRGVDSGIYDREEDGYFLKTPEVDPFHQPGSKASAPVPPAKPSRPKPVSQPFDDDEEVPPYDDPFQDE